LIAFQLAVVEAEELEQLHHELVDKAAQVEHGLVLLHQQLNWVHQ
jgi:hypothetical protein